MNFSFNLLTAINGNCLHPVHNSLQLTGNSCLIEETPPVGFAQAQKARMDLPRPDGARLINQVGTNIEGGGHTQPL